jgi:hypothetical protein
MNKILSGLIGFFLLPAVIIGTERMPWYGKSLEIEPRLTYLYQNFQDFKAGPHSLCYPSNDHFIIASIGSSYDRYAVEYEFVVSSTRYLSTGMDCQRLTGRTLILNDVTGDPISLTAGVTLTQASPGGVKDPGSFHHGRVEMEWHGALGKEWSCDSTWESRAWVVAGLGLADSGSPWIRADAAWENNYMDTHLLGIFVNTLWGLGGNSVHSLRRFDGYGPIHHQSVDWGIRYAYTFCGNYMLTLAYSRRVYAENFPLNANLCMATLYVPFGL